MGLWATIVVIERVCKEQKNEQLSEFWISLTPDGHLLVYNLSTQIAYDYWQATTQRNGVYDSLGSQPGNQILI